MGNEDGRDFGPGMAQLGFCFYGLLLTLALHCPPLARYVVKRGHKAVEIWHLRALPSIGSARCNDGTTQTGSPSLLLVGQDSLPGGNGDARDYERRTQALPLSSGPRASSGGRTGRSTRA